MEKYYDGELNEYQVVSERQPQYMKQLYWDIAIGLQKVDGLNPSKYMENLIKKNINGEINNNDIEVDLKKYYDTQDIKLKNISEEKECDLVSTRIVNLLETKDFELSIECIKNIHRYLFKDIYDFNGQFRNVNIIKNEPILNNDTVSYSSYDSIESSLEYDLTLQKNKNYNEMNIVDIISDLTNFTSKIWQVHPFREGNTRTTAVFIMKYLRKFKYSVNNELFKDKSVYFRNALVRSNYYNNYLNIKENNTYLIKFYENLLLDKNNNLQSKDLVINELF